MSWCFNRTMYGYSSDGNGTSGEYHAPSTWEGRGTSILWLSDGLGIFPCFNAQILPGVVACHDIPAQFPALLGVSCPAKYSSTETPTIRFVSPPPPNTTLWRLFPDRKLGVQMGTHMKSMIPSSPGPGHGVWPLTGSNAETQANQRRRRMPRDEFIRWMDHHSSFIPIPKTHTRYIIFHQSSFID